MSYLLDTDIIVDYFHGKEDVVRALTELSLKTLYTSVINIAELSFGIYNSENPDKHAEELASFLKKVGVLNIDLEVCNLFGRIKAKLKKVGTTVDNFDLFIGCICVAANLTLVTRNKRHFSLIPDLKILVL